MVAQISVLAEAVDLLGNVLKQWGASKGGSKSKDIRKSFINRHAWNIHDIGQDVLVLARAGRLGSIYLLSRPALESLFKLAGAVADEKLAAQKVVAEIEEECDKVRHWRAAATEEWSKVLDEIMKGLREFGEELRTRYGVTEQRKWKVFELAKLGDLEAEYVRDYFAGSKHVHGMLSALTERERQRYVPEALYRFTDCVIYTGALVNRALMVLENSVIPMVFENATELQERARQEYDVVSAAASAQKGS